MPSNVKLFFALTCAVVAYWLITTALFWVRVGIPLIAIGGLENQMVRVVTERNVEVVLFVTVPLCAVTLGLAWLVAYRHQSWARFAFLGVVLVREVGGSVYEGGRYAWKYYLQVHLARPDAYLPTAVFLFASLLIFTGNARPWFTPSPKFRNPEEPVAEIGT
jgi:hypothetical protein